MIHNENKQAIAVYMKWRYWPGGYGQCYRVTEPWGKTVLINFDSNDASLCVQEMQKRGEFAPFYDDLLDTYNGLCEDGKATCGADNFTAWLFNPENFFGAMAAWIKEGI